MIRWLRANPLAGLYLLVVALVILVCTASVVTAP